jgi:hypothetical protein
MSTTEPDDDRPRWEKTDAGEEGGDSDGGEEDTSSGPGTERPRWE